MTKLEDPWVEIKRKELVRAIELAAGLWIDAAADVWNAPPGSEVELSLSVLNRSDYPLTWSGAEVRGVARESVEPEPGPLKYNRISRRTLALKIPQNAPYSQPAWLERSGQNAFYDLDDPTLIGLSESPPALQATFHLHDQDGAQVAITKPVLYRWVDRASGERIRSIEIVPAVAVGFSRTNLIFPDNEPRAVALRIVSNTSGAAGTASLTVPAGWRSIPETQPFEVTRRGQELTLQFDLHPPAGVSSGRITAQLDLGGSDRVSRFEDDRIPSHPDTGRLSQGRDAGRTLRYPAACQTNRLCHGLG